MPRREKQAGWGDGGREAGAAPFTARDPRRGWHTPVDNRVGAGGPQDPECKCVRISRCRARSAALPISPPTLLFAVSFPSQLNFVLGAARALHVLRALADAHLPPSPQRRVRLLSCSLAARPETWRFSVSLLDHRARPRQPHSASHRAGLAASTLSPCVCSQPGDHRQSPKSRSGPGTPLLRPRRWFLVKVES